MTIRSYSSAIAIIQAMVEEEKAKAAKEWEAGKAALPEDYDKAKNHNVEAWKSIEHAKALENAVVRLREAP